MPAFQVNNQTQRQIALLGAIAQKGIRAAARDLPDDGSNSRKQASLHAMQDNVAEVQGCPSLRLGPERVAGKFSWSKVFLDLLVFTRRFLLYSFKTHTKQEHTHTSKPSGGGPVCADLCRALGEKYLQPNYLRNNCRTTSSAEKELGNLEPRAPQKRSCGMPC
jgi:hypothetical protein